MILYCLWEGTDCIFQKINDSNWNFKIRPWTWKENASRDQVGFQSTNGAAWVPQSLDLTG